MDCKDYFLKSNQNLFIHKLNDYGELDLDLFNDFINGYQALIELYKENKEEYVTNVLEANDILIYTLALLSYHHSNNDIYEIKNYKSFKETDFSEDMLLDTYIINRVRESLAQSIII